MSELVIRDGVLIKYTGGHSLVRLPASVKEIEERAFFGNTSVLEITLSPEVRRIGREAFVGCGCLRTVRFSGAPVREIPNGCFQGCHALEWVRLSEHTERIGGGAFSGCHSLRTVMLPASLREIGDSAFCGCGALLTLSLPQGLHTIGSSAFENCVSLSAVELPEGLREIGRDAFLGIHGLQSLRIPTSSVCVRQMLLRTSFEPRILWRTVLSEPLLVPNARSALLERRRQIHSLIFWGDGEGDAELLELVLAAWERAPLELLDGMIEAAGKHTALLSRLMEYKHTHYSARELDRIRQARIDQTLSGVCQPSEGTGSEDADEEEDA